MTTYLKAAGVLLLLLISSMQSAAQNYKGVQITNASLITGSIQPGKGFTLGIRFKLEPGWHTYWKNPGDAGLPLEATLIDAPDLVAGALRFPTPRKLTSEDVATYGYEDEVIYLLPIKPKTAQAAKHFKVKLSWLACNAVCLPAEETIEFNYDSIPAEDLKENQRLLDRWTARLPQPGEGFNLDKSGATLSNEKGGAKTIYMKFFGVTPGTITDFFPEEIPDFVIDYSKIVITPDVITMTVNPSTTTATLKQIKGLAMIGTSGYEVTVDVTN